LGLVAKLAAAEKERDELRLDRDTYQRHYALVVARAAKMEKDAVECTPKPETVRLHKWNGKQGWFVCQPLDDDCPAPIHATATLMEKK
jgi:hypothetical protein